MNKLGKGFLGVLCFGALAPQAPAHEREVPNLQGRWEFAIISGDTPSQLNGIGQMTFSTYLLQSGHSLTNVVPFTIDNSECDKISFDNITVDNSTVDSRGRVKITFTVGNGGDPSQAPFQYVFTGTLKKGDFGDADGRPAVITGTYQKTAGGCTQGSLGTNHPDGEFAATHFPDMNGNWAGTLDDGNPANGNTGSPALLSLHTLEDHSVSGQLKAPALNNAGGLACFDGPVQFNSGLDGSFGTGVLFELFGQDNVGTQLVMIGFSVNPDGSPAAVGEDKPSDGKDGTVNDGTNRDLSISFAVVGGPCDGLAANNQAFTQLRNHSHNDPNKLAQIQKRQAMRRGLSVTRKP